MCACHALDISSRIITVSSPWFGKRPCAPTRWSNRTAVAPSSFSEGEVLLVMTHLLRRRRFARFDTYYPYYGDVARLDKDADGVPCEKLPHTPLFYRRRIKKPVAGRLVGGVAPVGS